jgi:hypothetical protein
VTSPSGYVQRTASQRFRRVFDDQAFYRHTGLYVEPYRPFQVGFMRRLFDHLQVPTPDAELEWLCERTSFSALTGRAQGEEDITSHMRNGVPGDWQRYLTPALVSHLDEVTRNLPEFLGY